MTGRRTWIMALVLGIAIAGGAFYAGEEWAEDEAMEGVHGASGTAMMTAPEGASEATRGYIAAMHSMSMAMPAEFTGDPDVDFVSGMIPHHKGAIDAARVVLAHGTDPEVRAFAEKVIAAQDAEVTWMTDWLKSHGK